MVDYGKTYLLRIINAALQDILFFAIAKHNITVVGTDASYTKPLKTDYIAISPGQTIDVLLETNQAQGDYYMAAKVYSSANGVLYDNTTTTAIVHYNQNYNASSRPQLPNLPSYNDTNASANFTGSLRSLADDNHPVHVPLNISTQLMFTVSVNTFPCSTNSCQGPNGSRLAASVNNISFEFPSIDILQAYYNHISGVYGDQFPSFPPFIFNFTAEDLPLALETPKRGTEVKVLEYNSTVELVLQGTNLAAGTDHPIHIHGYSFYVVGWGFGNFDKDKDPLGYNLVDPPLQNTIAVPKNGWATIRFKADNPGKLQITDVVIVVTVKKINHMSHSLYSILYPTNHGLPYAFFFFFPYKIIETFLKNSDKLLILLLLLGIKYNVSLIMFHFILYQL